MLPLTIEVPGLQYFPEYVTSTQHDWLLEKIDQQPWSNELRRRVQHYGYRYDYKSKKVDPSSMFLGPLPDWVIPFLENRLYKDKLITQLPDQLIINEYEPGQGIAPHIDCVPCFGETIISLSLLSSCVMRFTHSETGRQLSLLLEPGSLLIMQGEARYKWKHGIAYRKNDNHEGQVLERSRRISLTFRNVIQ